jgi:hypothetical protein
MSSAQSATPFSARLLGICKEIINRPKEQINYLFHYLLINKLFINNRILLTSETDRCLRQLRTWHAPSSQVNEIKAQPQFGVLKLTCLTQQLLGLSSLQKKENPYQRRLIRVL